MTYDVGDSLTNETMKTLDLKHICKWLYWAVQVQWHIIGFMGFMGMPHDGWFK